MSDVYAVFGTLLALGIAFPGMLTAFWLLFPATVERTELRIESAPWKSFWFGISAAIAIGIPVVVLMNLSLGILQFIGFLMLRYHLASILVLWHFSCFYPSDLFIKYI